MATIDRPTPLNLTVEERETRRQHAERARENIKRKLAAGERLVPADGLGLWGGEPVDGMAYQEWIRGV